ncbi:hypothetical protein LRB11_01415 [Ectothiorhodospira haloalkaliphila]|uniref:hypothetical protein n=1 Tax=Ectothiorhodospira haloalkaliphila TaxID=421628 RepID=UPI001EE98F2D|nr:hypothetical protein [Ectothiorhodospira haloalkaliphila]MCG5523588.1 hypothetical protein [Ectothiorhodospira haloalkaliphila]
MPRIKTTPLKNMPNVAHRLTSLMCILTLALTLTACGDGGGGDTFTPLRLSVSVDLEKDNVPVNTAQAQAAPGSPYVSQVAIRVTERGSGHPAAADVTISFDGPTVGGFLSEEDFFNGQGTPVPSLNLSTESDGRARAYFVAGTLAGEARIRVRADRQDEADPNLGASTTRILRVVGEAGPASALEFTGPYIDAIRTNRVQFGPAEGESIDFQNGTYSRVISVTATDANGNPVPTNTPIHFRLIDAPLQGYPSDGSGRFAITGNDGNPLEGGFNFTAPGGNFIGQGVRISDRLVLDPDPDSRSFYHAGIRSIAQLPPAQPNVLQIRADAQPFRVGEDQGNTVPYIIGRAQAGSIQSLAFTDANGTASTLLTYPFSNVGRTAIIVAHTEDFSVSRVFNPGTAVYLGSVGDGLSLTTSTSTLPANVTDGLVDICLRDGNAVPITGGNIQFFVEDNQSGADVDVNDLGESGTLTTGTAGCVTATINVSRQPPGSGVITLKFISQGVEAELTILAAAMGNLTGNLNCAAGTLDLLYLTAAGTPIPDAFIFVSNFDWPDGSPNFRFSPASDAGTGAGTTNDSGQVRVNFDLGGVVDSQDTEYTATLEAPDDTFQMNCVRRP